jgi:hypothetical protein
MLPAFFACGAALCCTSGIGAADRGEYRQAAGFVAQVERRSTICDLGHRNNCCQELFGAVVGSPDQEGIMPSLSHTHEGNDDKHHRECVFVLALVCMWLTSVVASAVVWRLLFALS